MGAPRGGTRAGFLEVGSAPLPEGGVNISGEGPAPLQEGSAQREGGGSCGMMRMRHVTESDS